MKKLVLITLFLLCATALMAAKPKDGVRNEAVSAALESRDYTIDVRTAMPSSGPSVQLNYSYNVKIKGDSLYCYLPYFGRAYSLPYGGGEGLNFVTTTTDYKQQKAKRDMMRISFNARTREDTYRFTIEVFPNGSSFVQVSPNNKQSISFNGDMEINDKKK